MAGSVCYIQLHQFRMVKCYQTCLPIRWTSDRGFDAVYLQNDDAGS